MLDNKLEEVPNMSTLSELREIKQDIRDAHEELGELKDELENHPDKALPGAKTDQIKKWVKIRDEILTRKREVVAELNELLAQREEMLESLKGTPREIGRNNLAAIIDRAIEVEFLLPEDPKAAHEKLTAYIDFLERVEATLEPVA